MCVPIVYKRIAMSKKIPDISDSGGQIRQIVDIEQFEEMARMLKIDPEKVPGFVNQINQEIHEFLTERERLEKRKNAKRKKQDIDFPSEIEKAAKRFQDLVSNAPLVICNNPDLLEISRKLSEVPSIFEELRQKLHLAELGMIDPYGGTESALRTDFIRGIHTLYSHFSGREDWITSDQYKDVKYTNPFFQLLTLCYRAAGLKAKDSTIRSHIEIAMKR